MRSIFTSFPAKVLLEKCIVLGAFFVIAFSYSFNVLHYWFLYDDPAAIVYSTKSLKDIFFSNDSYVYGFYAPLLALIFKPDVLLFGIHPLPYRIHNLIVLVLIAFLVYQILSHYTDKVSSILSAIVVLCATPSLICVIWITLRQYLYPMLFSLIAIYLYLKYKPDPKHHTYVFLTILVLSELSFMGKEQFMTLPFIFLILSEENFRNRFFKTYPYFLLFALHFLLRWYVLGSMGGYLGVIYNPLVYLKTVFTSILTTSEILFGTKWLVAVLLLPFLLKPDKLMQLVLLWTATLAVSFLGMSLYPSADTYRYWFIAAVLFSFMIGFGSALIKNPLLRGSYILVIVIPFFIHSLKINEEIKVVFHNESSIAYKTSKSMLDNKYRNAVMMFPDSPYTHSGHIYSMQNAYQRILGVEALPVFYPFELLAFYPEILQDFDSVYEITQHEIIDITQSIKKRSDFFIAALADQKPEFGLLQSGKELEVSLKCRSGRFVTSFIIEQEQLADKQRVSKNVLPYLERLNLSNIIKKSGNAKLVPIEEISYKKKTWYFGKERIPNATLLITSFCSDTSGKNTRLSDVLYIPLAKRFHIN